MSRTRNTVRYYLDTEFYEDGQTIDLISIALVCEDGREFYAVNQEAKLHLVSPWVRQNVLPKLPPYSSQLWRPRQWIAKKISAFTMHDDRPEFWAYYADYDWVALCQLYGTMMGLPRHMPNFCMDLEQLAVMKGQLNSDEFPLHPVGVVHDALEDARWNKQLHEFLEKYPWPTE